MNFFDTEQMIFRAEVSLDNSDDLLSDSTRTGYEGLILKYNHHACSLWKDTIDPIDEDTYPTRFFQSQLDLKAHRIINNCIPALRIKPDTWGPFIGKELTFGERVQLLEGSIDELEQEVYQRARFDAFYPIENTSYKYFAGSGGNIYVTKGIDGCTDKRIITGQLREHEADTGYLYVKIKTEGKTGYLWVHQAVARSLMRPPLLPCYKLIRHVNGNKKDNRVFHLQYGTAKQNAKDTSKHLQMHGREFKRLTAATVLEARYKHDMGASVKDLAEEFGTSYKSMQSAISRKTWSNI